ncbi:hypothetical protein [Lichenicoccus roseus]|uniref:DUF596 domain-containing protein n=1 Tax=Lichenicoccus roseus TaxID=2683649 RepID=A0A5R9J1D1_9PROT|nr:hypothetical protein [Lichenicoccus roseus]TLU70653.1 hypothetical protein FE263_20910 [Lichenicoccus roseus]
MSLSEKARHEATEEGARRDLIGLFKAVQERCASDIPAEHQKEFLDLVRTLLRSGRLHIKLDPAAFPDASATSTAEEVVSLLQQNWPKPEEMKYEYDIEMLIFIESSCQVWWADWGEPNDRFRSYY